MKSTKPIPALNVKLLRRIEEHISAEPRRLKMVHWVDRENAERSPETQPPCGTTACIAGWAVLLSGDTATKFGWSTEGKAQRYLGINAYQSEVLFRVENWPLRFKKRYDLLIETSNGDRPTIAAIRKNARAVVARIEHFIKTGE